MPGSARLKTYGKLRVRTEINENGDVIFTGDRSHVRWIKRELKRLGLSVKPEDHR
jgi:hypothetical protein